MSFNRYPKMIVAGTLAGVFVLSLPSFGEARHSSRTDQTMVTTTRSVNTGSSRNVSRNAEKQMFQERIDAILNAHKKGAEESVSSSVSVPTTVSEYDDSIIGTPMASQQQCVDYLLSVNPTPNISVTPQELVSYYYEEGA